MFKSTKVIELGSCAFRQPTATSHCKYLHGYRLTAKFWFEADALDQNNWVVDFGGLKDLKMTLQDQFDHTTCVSIEDPKLPLFKQLFDEGLCDLRIMDGVGIEKFAEFCQGTAQRFVDGLTDGRCRCVKVEVFKHENNSAIYEVKSNAIQPGNKVNEPGAENEESLNNFTGNQPKINNKPQPIKQTKTINKWVDEKSTNVWGM